MKDNTSQVMPLIFMLNTFKCLVPPDNLMITSLTTVGDLWKLMKKCIHNRKHLHLVLGIMRIWQDGGGHIRSIGGNGSTGGNAPSLYVRNVLVCGTNAGDATSRCLHN